MLPADFTAKVTGLRGRRITSVGYWDVFDDPDWDHDDWHHAVMGVELGTDQGPVTITWTPTYFPYGVEAFHEPIGAHLGAGCFEARPGAGRWDPFLESPILGGAVNWTTLQAGPGRTGSGRVTPAHTEVLPTACRLDFAAGSVWFAAAIPGENGFFWPGDEIVVVFTRERIRAIGFDDPAFLG